MPVDRISDLYIGGRWRAAGSADHTVVTNPTTEEPLARVVDGDAADVDAAVRAAAAAARGWAATPVDDRCALVRRLAGELERRAAELSATITRENGTPVGESSHAPAQAATHLRNCAEVAPAVFAEDVRANPMAPGDTVVQRRPLGVAGLITP